MLTIFKKEKKADVRILHICGIKIKYKKKYKIKSINKQHVQNEINRSKINGISSSKRKPELIVSLTSFPQRIYDLHFCIYSLLKQSLKPDKIILWLGQDEFPNKEKDLTEDLIKFTRMGLTIRFCKDIGSYTKLIYALREFPDDIIITADDDIYYEKNWLEKLYNAYKKQPDMIS